MDSKLLMELITIPLFTGVIGYITNWTGVLMLFSPIKFYGFRVPGLKFLYPYFPRRVQVLPTFGPDARFGWQGMVPSRAEKMASIAVDKSLVKLGSVKDFYRQLDPDSIASHFVAVATPEIRNVVERIMIQENPRLWYNLPGFAKEAIYRKVEAELPANAQRITDELGEHIEELIDPKWMAIRHLTEHPKLLNSIMRDMGAKELKFMINFGFYFGYPMGFLLVGVLHFLPYWWVLPLGGIVIGYIVNYIGLNMLYEPIHPNRWLPWKQGLILHRREEIIEGFAGIVATDVITTDNMARELLHGPRSDRTKLMLDAVMRDAVDSAVGPARIAVKTAVGSAEYDRIQASLGPTALEFATGAMADKEFAERQASNIRNFVVAQMSKLSLDDFVDLLRAATRQDEWLLFLHGAVLGSVGGFVHLAIFGV